MSDLLLFVGVFAGIFILIRKIVSGKRCKSKAKLHGKTVIITGSNTGIGRETAVDLARRGARVILACRSIVRAEAALAIVKRESQSKNVVAMQLDLASQKSVRSFAETFLKTEKRLDILINNAGLAELCTTPFSSMLIIQDIIRTQGVYMHGTTEDGLGLMFGVNHIGHFLLTNLLLDRLQECGPSRIVTVSSTCHHFGNLDFNLLSTHKEFGKGNSVIDCFRMYSNSKLCNVLFTHELAKRLQGTPVTCYSLHPGAINSELARNFQPGFKKVLKFIGALFFKDVEAGAQTTLYCALQEGIEGLSGQYFSNCEVKSVSAKAQDDAVAKKLWEVSEKFCGLA